ncbi:MAG TPA: ABC transporter permease, partial [Candidatus Limnocylindria bacterium]|nr:ABC transporter permease [Candidatus Limnocylindria bacterium]
MRLGDLAWRGLAARPLRTALTIVGVALGVAVLAATLTAGQAATEAVRRAAQELYGEAELRVRAVDQGGFTPRAVSALRQVPGVLDSAAVSEKRGQAAVEPDRLFPMLLVGVDPLEEERLRSHPLVSGTFLDPATAHGVLVTASWAEENGFAVGDELLLNGRRRGVPPVRIVGLLDDAGFGALASGSVMLLSRDFLGQAFEGPAPVRYVDLQVAPGRAGGVQAALDAAFDEPFVVETVADAERQLERAQAGFAGLAFLFSMVALGVGAFLVANTLGMTVAERTREIGLLRAAGTTSRQVLSVFLRQGAAIGILGSLAGVLVGVLVAVALIGLLRSTRAVLVTGVPLHPGALALALVLGVVVALAAAAWPAVAASRVSPLDALRPSRQPGRTLRGRLPWLAAIVAGTVLVGIVAYPLDRGTASSGGVLLTAGVLLGGVLLVAVLLQPLSTVVGRPFALFFGAEGLLGGANLRRDRVRTGLTVGALSIGLAAVVALSAVSASARETASRWVESILPGGYAIRLGAADDIDFIRPTVEGIAGARMATPIVEAPAVIVEGDVAREAWLAGIDPTVFQDEGALIFVAGRRTAAFEALRGGGSVLLPEPLAESQGLAVGDTIQVALPGEEPHRLGVAGIVAYSLPSRGTEGALLVSLSEARQTFGITQAELWALAPQPDIPPDAFVAAVEDAALGRAGEPLTAAGLADELGRSVGRLIGLFDVLALLAVVIGGLGVVNTLAMGVAERARE